MIHVACHRAIVHMYKPNARHAIRFKILGFRSVSDVKFIHVEVAFLQAGLLLTDCNKKTPNPTTEEQCSISFSHEAFRYLAILSICAALYHTVYIPEVCLKDPERFPALTWQSLTLPRHSGKVLIFPDASVPPVPSYDAL